ncbi:hypothetical protein EDD17DRAFT_1871677 [Pisolithus thermaeus]|nr:hypothetical protein EV401DRAFT_2082821 [Pisolithus croceorrhizus]KAI6165527.1 hypothetical protein EDD17DRAFT_1871677 [Pisolithus thermaeus]
MFTKTFLPTVAATILFAASASAICPEYKFGITQNGDNGAWQVFDNAAMLFTRAAPPPYTLMARTMLARPTPVLIPATVTLFKSAAIDRVKPLDPWTE